VGGFFGVASRDDCVADLYYGTDYHSHLGTMRGGLAVHDGRGIRRFIHDITNAQFRSKFEDDLPKLKGFTGIGVISDYDDQPLIIRSHHGAYAIVTVGRLDNLDELVATALRRGAHFSEMSGEGASPTQVVANLIDQGESLIDGISAAQDAIKGSCSILLLADDGVYAARDLLGRTPVAIGTKPGSCAATLETCALANTGYEVNRYLGPGEVVRVTQDGVEQLRPLFAAIWLPLIVVPTLWAILAGGRSLLGGENHPWTWALLFVAIVIPFLPASTLLDLSAMPRFASPLVALTILFAAYHRRARVLNASLLWMTTAVLVPLT